MPRRARGAGSWPVRGREPVPVPGFEVLVTPPPSTADPSVVDVDPGWVVDVEVEVDVDPGRVVDVVVDEVEPGSVVDVVVLVEVDVVDVEVVVDVVVVTTAAGQRPMSRPATASPTPTTMAS